MKSKKQPSSDFFDHKDMSGLALVSAYSISHNGSMIVASRIQRQVGCTYSHLHNIIQMMMKRELVKGKKKGRAYIYELTAKGKEAGKHLLEYYKTVGYSHLKGVEDNV